MSEDIIEQYKKQNKPIKLNIGCGQQRQDGFIGLDKEKTGVTDIVQNLETYPWPFEDNSVDEIVCSHYVEHVRDLIPFIDEMHRIMKQGAKATIVAPYYASMRACQDPTHVRFICEASFLYFNKGWRDANKLDHYQISSDFDFSYGYSVSPEWANRSEDARVFAMKHYINVINDIHVVLTKR
jgi:SAM-dependent methyltransferase